MSAAAAVAALAFLLAVVVGALLRPRATCPCRSCTADRVLARARRGDTP